MVLRGDIVGGKLLGSINGLCEAQKEGGEILRASEDWADRDRRDNLMEELEIGLIDKRKEGSFQ